MQIGKYETLNEFREKELFIKNVLIYLKEKMESHVTETCKKVIFYD